MAREERDGVILQLEADNARNARGLVSARASQLIDLQKEDATGTFP